MMELTGRKKVQCRKLFLGILCVLILMCSRQVYARENIEQDSIVSSRTYDARASKVYRSKWVKKNGSWYYYNKKGKILKDGIYEIKGSYYHFGKKGRRTSERYVDSIGFNCIFSVKTGKMVSRYIPLKVMKIYGNDDRGYSFNTRSYKAKGRANNNIYAVGIAKDEVNTRMIDKKGRKVKASQIKKGSVIWVYTDSMYILEGGGIIPGIEKIVVVKK